MWFLSLLFGFGFVSSTQVNHTIDDASPLVTYRAVIDRNLTGFNSSLLNNGTVTFIPATEHDSPTISMNFTGTAIYVFVAYPAGHNESFTSGFSARIDGVPYGGWAATQTAPLVNHLAYHNTTMPNGPHNFVIQVQPEWELYFDYAVYTSGDPDPSLSSNSASPTNTSSVSASDTGKKFHVGAVVGGVIGGLILLALFLTPFLLRKRAKAKRNVPRPFVQGLNRRSSHDEEDKEVLPPPMDPFLLPSPSPARVKERVDLSLNIPNNSNVPRATMLSGTELSPSPLSTASDPTLLQMAEDLRRLRMSVQRLETDSDTQRPPAYGMSEAT
ncbi:hypothetical protein MVEN_02332400 [Mycena venus]|uniref:Uncharacterized protein n=1 Tax=Mycena venus TaxID=2733690 RepID=A0A8H6X405_9AGAR|nr:hypothetical protein MVEN_02332400 [Mycena venus]